MTRRILLLSGILIAVGALIIPAGRGHTNCGGNTAALNNVQQIALFARTWSAESPDHSFRFTAANAEQRTWLAALSEDTWCPGARFLVTTDLIVGDAAHERGVIVVCDTPYRNVPQQMFGNAPPTHAAVFSDGSDELISTDQFDRLDRSKFVALDELAPPTSE